VWDLESTRAIWSVVRDVATFALGIRWGEQVISAQGPADAAKIALVATLLGLPFAFRQDELRRRGQERERAENGSDGRSSTERAEP
jgi:hypothetical protein